MWVIWRVILKLKAGYSAVSEATPSPPPKDPHKNNPIPLYGEGGGFLGVWGYGGGRGCRF